MTYLIAVCKCKLYYYAHHDMIITKFQNCTSDNMLFIGEKKVTKTF